MPRITMDEKIEVSLRESNMRRQRKLEIIIANCDFAIAYTHNKQLREFAEIIKRLSEAEF